MNWRKRTLSTFLLALAVSCSMAVQAQTDAFLQRYDLAMENLNVAVASVPDDSAKATDELDQAVNALLSLSRDTTSPSLVSSMERLFDRARTAVQNRSTADIAVQTAVLAGGFRRLVFESAFVSAAAGDLATAQARLGHLATDMAMPQDVRDSLNAAADPADLRLRFEAGIAKLVQNDVATARTESASDRAAAYLALAKAYGASLMLQDSPRLATPMNDGFVAAANALVSNDTTAFAASTQELETSAAAVVAATTSGAGAEATTPPPATTGTAAVESADLPTLGDTAQAADQTPPATGTAPAASPQDASAPPAAGAAASAAAPADLEALRATWESERLAEQRTELVAQIRTAGLPGAAGEKLADTLIAADVPDLNGAVQRLYAGAGRATAAVIAGNLDDARAEIDRTGSEYRALVAPLVASRSPGTDEAMRSALDRASSVIGLRMQDVDALTGQVDAVARVTLGQAASANQQLNERALALWAGWPRLIVMLLFGILAFVPLYLLNLAFGGGNRNWQLIGVSLFLLLLPVVYEALAAIGSLVAYLTGDDAFEVLSTYSMFQSPIGQVAWALLIVIAILLAISGLYGICVQFGLLGRRRRGAGAGPSATQTNTATMDATGVRQPADALVDWDEDF